MFIQRKSHPNGLLNYLAITYVENSQAEPKYLPFIDDVNPHLVNADAAPQGECVV